MAKVKGFGANAEVDADALKAKPIKAVKVAIMLAATRLLDALERFEYVPDDQEMIVEITLKPIKGE